MGGGGGQGQVCVKVRSQVELAFPGNKSTEVTVTQDRARGGPPGPCVHWDDLTQADGECVCVRRLREDAGSAH